MHDGIVLLGPDLPTIHCPLVGRKGDACRPIGGARVGLGLPQGDRGRCLRICQSRDFCSKGRCWEGGRGGGHDCFLFCNETRVH